jgi:diaminohydroxyphosphoribosylaminopyrimidine deaminase/5-amino-6-(5-phosphoribosylamino)uracil reductase
VAPVGVDLPEQMMRRALALAEHARYRARPNPHVGCVIWRDGVILGEGATRAPGQAHAEIVALQDAEARGHDVCGADVAVTLEPCSHRGRTGPCVDALLAAGVATVYAACGDPNPEVNGRGLARLRDGGVSVHCGLLADEALAQNAGFHSRMRRGRPRLRLKMAASLDGRTAMASGESRWITGAAARADVQRLRAQSCAVLTGIGTVLADDCRLSLRPDELPLTPPQTSDALEHPPARVILDARLRTPADAAVLAADARGSAGAPLLLHGTGLIVPAWLEARRQSGELSLHGLPSDADGRLDLHALVEELARRQFNEILVECGSRLAGALVREGLVDQMCLYLAPCFMGSSARPLLDLSLDLMADRPRWRYVQLDQLGDDIRILAEPS